MTPPTSPAGLGTALLVGNPTASAINAPQGKKYDAFKDAYGNVLVDREIGGTIGALAGAGAGAGAGALLMRTQTGKRAAARIVNRATPDASLAKRLAGYKAIRSAATPAGGLVGALAGLGIGGTAGMLHGHYGKRAQEIRNRHLSADLKPALRELAARSEEITEFAMVRDASGRYVEVPEESKGFPTGTAVKAGLGAAALGGAGYGAYRGHQALMGKYGTFGPMPVGQSRTVTAYGDAAKAGLAKGKGLLRGSLLKIARGLR